jgi:hypothetical protein
VSHLIIDMDFLKYAAASVGEKRTILVTHKTSGKERPFANRTEFWGRSSKTIGGWLGDLNVERAKEGKEPFGKEDFDIQDVQTAEPVENVLHTVKMMMEGVFTALGTRHYKGFVGAGDTFRLERSTILKYKGNRDDLIKPVHLEAVHDYLIKVFKAEEITEIEADDRCVMECYKTDNILVGVDKDYYGTPVHYYNTNRGAKEGIIDCNQFGKLWRDEKGDVRGYGRIFFYWQVLSGDKVDNYAANSASGVPWADVSAYNALSGTADDKEALQALVDAYKTTLYPEPRVITGWRGEEIRADWLYVASENWDLARMLRFERDEATLPQVLEKLNVRA